jgi:hypothetical protein
VTDLVGNHGVAGKQVTWLQVFPGPVPTISGPDTVCEATGGNRYVTESGMIDYSWTVSSGGTIVAGEGTDTITVDWSTGGSQTVKLIYTDINGHSNFFPTVKNVLVKPRPVPSISGSDAVCEGTAGVVYTTESGMTGYSWAVSPGGQITSGSGSRSVVVTWNSPGMQTISINYTAPNGCSAASSSQKNIMVYSLTIPGYASGDTTLGLGFQDSLVLQAYNGSVVAWQKRHNGGMFVGIPNSGGNSVYREVPDTTGTWDYRAEVKNGPCASLFSNHATVNVVPVTRTINLTLMLEGLFNPSSGMMNKAQEVNGDKYPGSIADKVQVIIARPVLPYSGYYSVEGVDLNQDGSCSVTVPRAGYYYIVVKHRNSIETWSSQPVYAFTDTIFFDFTTAASQAYGDNLKGINGKWVIFGGDVNQDGIVDISDMNPVDNASTAITFGYVDEDVNGDGIVDVGDLNIVDNNSTAIIISVTP